jgi:hypothetical protein
MPARADDAISDSIVDKNGLVGLARLMRSDRQDRTGMPARADDAISDCGQERTDRACVVDEIGQTRSDRDAGARG